MNKRKKYHVATLTFHIAHNFGAMLQAYALEKAINNLGYECEVIDYRFKYIDSWSGVQTWRDLVRNLDLIRGTIEYYCRKKKGQIRNQTPMQSRFNRFMRKDIKLSRQILFSAEDLRKVDYDVVILGSDQIWNPKLTDGIALEYYGYYFDKKNIKVFSYAASCGKERYSIEDEKKIVPLLRELYRISVREKRFSEYLNSECGLISTMVIDPVFLLAKNDWCDLIKKCRKMYKRPYLLLYAFDASKDIYDVARKISSEHNLDLVSIGYQYNDELSDFTQFNDCGPKEFLSLLKYSDYVCTTSFHGVAFSLIFNKNFYCFSHPEYGLRTTDLLQMLNMEKRILNSFNADMKIEPCDFSTSNMLIDKYRKKAVEYIVGSIEE